jgi:hypothetical protein
MPMGSGAKRSNRMRAGEAKGTHEGVFVDRETGGHVLTIAHIRWRDALGRRSKVDAIG